MKNDSDQEKAKELTDVKFAKLFYLKDSQLLLRWEYNTEDDAYDLSFEFVVDGIRALLTLGGFKDIEDCLEAFLNIDKKGAEEMYKAIVKDNGGNPFELIFN